MAYVPGFEYDLFISYASDDLDDRLKGLVQDLRVYLRRELGKEFDVDRGIFLDRDELNVTPVQWKNKLRDSAQSAAILVPILTPSWASSLYCAKEWEWFLEDSPLNWPAGTETVFRVCPVRWRELDSDVLQQIAVEIRSAQEHRSLNAEDLGAKLAAALRLMRRSRQTVYVGETDDDIRDKVRSEMSRMGFRVEPQSPMAFENQELVRSLLGKARLAVHFVGKQDKNRAIEAIRWSREYCQYATVLYEIPGVDLSDEEQVLLEWFEEDLKNAQPADARAYDRISGKSKNLDQFLHVMKDRLEGTRPVAPTQVGIACEDADRPAVESLIPEIQGRTGFSVTCHGMSLLDFKKSRAILLYWGTAQGARLCQARQVIKAYCTFFFAPPPKPEERSAELAGCEILHQRQERFDIDDIRPFLERLGWKG
jgi:hypothetical protein